MIFGIPLISRAAARDWSVVVHQLDATLQSLNRQTSNAYHIIIGGTDEPDLESSRVGTFEFIHCPDLAGDDKLSKRSDKLNKHFMIARRAREIGGGSLMFVDSDDLVSRRVVSFVEQNPHASGYLFADGYILNVKSGEVAPYPFAGYERYPFDQICGTCAVLRFSPDELPRDDSGDSLFDRIYSKGHRFVRRHAFEEGRPLAKLPFRGAAYIKETGQNLSQSAPESPGSRFHAEIVRRMAEHVVEFTPELKSEFSFAGADY